MLQCNVNGVNLKQHLEATIGPDPYGGGTCNTNFTWVALAAALLLDASQGVGYHL